MGGAPRTQTGKDCSETNQNHRKQAHSRKKDSPKENSRNEDSHQEDRQKEIRPAQKEDGAAMSQIDDFEDPSGNSAEELSLLHRHDSIPTALKGHGLIPAESSVESTEALPSEYLLDGRPVLYQGTTSVVPHEAQNEAGALAPAGSPSPEPPEFYSFPVEPPSPTRIPHLGHLGLLAAFLFVGFICMMVVMAIGLLIHFDGVTKIDQIKSHIVYLLGSEAVLYLATFALSYFLFPLFWQKSFFAGIQWRGRTAFKWSGLLMLLAVGCFGLALLDQALLPGPKHAPIEDMFTTPAAAWMMFLFGVTIAPFFEEMFFRGFLLPALATAYDWIIEKSTGKTASPLDANGHPQWSLAAMIAAAIPTSLLFAQIHVDQQGHSLGPFLLLVVVSLILCVARLKLRSVAASTFIHACYNFLIFSIMLIGTDGFRHLDKM
jgi:membrane protease YdiL (CAAX protease family)